MVHRRIHHLESLELCPQGLCLPGALPIHCCLPGKPAASTSRPLATRGGQELSRGQDSVLRDWGSKARVDSCASQTLFLEKNSLLPTTWSSFLESCPSVYVLKTSLHVCSVEPGTAAWRKHGLQMDREEGVQRGQRTKPGKFPSGPVSERRAPASGPQKKRVC